MGTDPRFCDADGIMSFDQNRDSPDEMVNPHKRTTKVNFGVAAGVVFFLVLGAVAVWLVARHYSG
jgi:hypothetical protein